MVILAVPATAQPAVGINLGTITTQSTAAPVASSQLTFSQVEELINKYTSELEEQEKVFINQATQVNTWDNLLHDNSKKVCEMEISDEASILFRQCIRALKQIIQILSFSKDCCTERCR